MHGGFTEGAQPLVPNAMLHDIASTAHAVESAAAAKRELQHHARHHTRELVVDAAADRPRAAATAVLQRKHASAKAILIAHNNRDAKMLHMMSERKANERKAKAALLEPPSDDPSTLAPERQIRVELVTKSLLDIQFRLTPSNARTTGDNTRTTLKVAMRLEHKITCTVGNDRGAFLAQLAKEVEHLMGKARVESETGNAKQRKSIFGSEKAPVVEAAMLIRRFIMFFTEADEHGSQAIDFDQFVSALPYRVREQHQADLRSWFELIDRNGDGLVALAECVHCGLSLAGMASGAGVLKIFEHYDLDHSGRLGEWEYTLAARDLGFGEWARTVFHTLPLHPEDQTIDYAELLNSTRLSQDEKTIGQGFLRAMAWEVGARARDVDTRGWSFTGEDAESARANLRALLRKQQVKLSEIFETIDASDDGRINLKEFVHGFHYLLGFHGRREIMEEIFHSLDDNSNGTLTFDELNAWIVGTGLSHRARIEAAKHLAFVPTCVHQDEPVWDAARLRVELRQWIEDAGLECADLFDAWDDDRSGTLRKKEWLVHFRNLTRRSSLPEELWYAKLRALCDEL